MPNTILGKVSITPKGNYSASAQYTMLDMVGYQGSSYLALTEVQGVLPSSNPEKWMLIAKKGENGQNGSPGKDGTPGKNGDRGPKGDTGVTYLSSEAPQTPNDGDIWFKII